ncbi:MAG: hypothetical protein PHR41_02660 [Lactococcus chungangensis]|uniref:Ubiquitin-like domain-containing protein n=2 Tax=Pseudolactococcus chungangensis CAU 28 = DSM 22330 TaxID=1122154 RepID=A0A1K2H9Y6_9LACT|nr:hypothetical protein [Lactococcus chungangensis]SFZ73607.1 hypothetical protein SAMN02746068_00876 [Lactococcus chungangensis CAU 28 = DSM 22330]
MLEITLVMQGIEVDMVVPKQVTFGRLRSLLRSVFLEHGNALPENIFLKIQDKTVRLKDSDWLSDFGIGNGDKIEIVVGESGESNEIV